jgi:hypothetical protein
MPKIAKIIMTIKTIPLASEIAVTAKSVRWLKSSFIIIYSFFYNLLNSHQIIR